MSASPTLAVVGLGYVGLPLAIEFARHYDVIGYDTRRHTIEALQSHRDPSGTFDRDELRAADRLRVSSDPAHIGKAEYVLVCVSTPVDEVNMPDLSALGDASAVIGRHIRRGATIIYESTVYPGATEEVCIPVLEQYSGMKWKQDFHVGYSPERVNPGDREHAIPNVVKVVSGDSPETLDACAGLYSSIVPAGVHRASSIKVAEACKVVENVQRDLNIALMNELAIIFGKLGIDTLEVLEAAGTKWNFAPFRPGLVGGHCIGVDPYYLTYKAESVGYHPQVILAGRRINDGMASYIAKITVRAMMHQGGCRPGDTVVVLGATFKEDCPDLRNSKVFALCEQLAQFGLNVVIHEPVAEPARVEAQYGIVAMSWDELPGDASVLIAAVAHSYYRQLPLSKLLTPLRAGGVFVDVKSAHDPEAIRQQGYHLLRL